MALTLAAIALACLSDEPLGRLTEQQMHSELKSAGYAIHKLYYENVRTSLTKLEKNKIEFFFSLDGQSDQLTKEWHVKGLTATALFDLPKPISKLAFADWAEKKSFKDVHTSSSIDGRVQISSRVQTFDRSKASLIKWLTNFEGYVTETAAWAKTRDGRRAVDFFGLGNAKFDRSQKLDWVEARDVEYLKAVKNWPDGHSPGGSRGWLVSAKVQGVNIYINGMFGSEASFFLKYMGKPNPGKAEQFLRSGRKVDWAEAYITQDFFDISLRLGPKGFTAGSLLDQIESFALKAGQLDLM